jgi:hypothetical protein
MKNMDKQMSTNFFIFIKLKKNDANIRILIQVSRLLQQTETIAQTSFVRGDFRRAKTISVMYDDVFELSLHVYGGKTILCPVLPD